MDTQDTDTETPPQEDARGPLRPLPTAPVLDPRRVSLGQRLFNDPRLSGDGTVACVQCHPLDRGGVDGLAHSRAVGGRNTAVNTPTVFNVAYSYRYNWNGAYTTLESELDAPVQRAMGTDFPSLTRRVALDPVYARDFRVAYGHPVTADAVRNALATYERSLVTPDAPFDRWLAGDTQAISADARAGYGIFTSYGCASCHQGANVGGNLFQRMGVMDDYFAARGAPTPADLGRYNATLNPDDRNVFRVPSLRNVAVTGPYFHDGSAATLPRAVTVMAAYQLGRSLTPTQVDQVVAFLQSLTGTWQGRPVGTRGG